MSQAQHVIGSLALALAVAGGCSATPEGAVRNSENPEAIDPMVEAHLQVVIAECAMLIGSVNAGVSHVQQMGQASADQDPFERTAQALESVARAIQETPYRTPDLQRIGGFYIGVARGQATTLRELDKAATANDERGVAEAQKRLDSLIEMESTVVQELNVQCRGRDGADASVVQPTPMPTAPPANVPPPAAPIPIAPPAYPPPTRLPGPPPLMPAPTPITPQPIPGRPPGLTPAPTPAPAPPLTPAPPGSPVLQPLPR